MEIAGGHHCPSNGLRRGQAPTAAPAGARRGASPVMVSAPSDGSTCARVQACVCESPATEAGREFHRHPQGRGAKPITP